MKKIEKLDSIKKRIVKLLETHEHFRNDDRVIVDNTPPWRKARLWGNLLIGWTHDANVRQTNVVNMLPQFFPELWGKSKFREWHTGHKHTKKEFLL